MSVDDELLPVPLPIAPPPMVAAPESSVLVEFGGKRLSGELRRAPGRRLRYALSVINDAPLYLLISFRVRRGGGDTPIAPGELWMDPLSHADLLIDIPALVGLAGGRLVVRLVNAKLQHELVAPLPGAAVWLGALGGAALAGLLAFGAGYARPHMNVLTVPPLGVGGAPLQVGYETGGIGAASYALEDDRGATIASGALAAASGVLSIPLPAADRTRNYVVRLRDGGALGSTERAQPVTAMPAPVPQLQLIDAFALDASQVSDGGTIGVRYRTQAQTGRIEVRDAQNTLWAQAPLARNGVSQLVLPRFGKDKELRVTLAVERNGQHESSSLGLNVVAAAPAAADANAASAPEGPPRVFDGTLGSDGMIHVAIGAGATNVRLALETPDGTPLSAQTVPAGATSAAIAVPHGFHGRIVLISTYDSGAGQESAVKAIDVP